LCPLKVSAVDFGHSAALIARARYETQGWLESGGADVEEPARYLSMHDHDAAPDRRSATVRPGGEHLTA
jgi:hypothetical protein